MNFKRNLPQLFLKRQSLIQMSILAIFAIFLLASFLILQTQQKHIDAANQVSTNFFQFEAQYAQRNLALLTLNQKYNPNFDQPERLHHQLQTLLQTLKHSLSYYPELTPELQTIQAQLTQEHQQILQLKSQIALYKNSYHYLPSALHTCLNQVSNLEDQEALLQLPLDIEHPQQLNALLNQLNTRPQIQHCTPLLRHAELLKTTITQIQYLYHQLTYSELPNQLLSLYQQYHQQLRAQKQTLYFFFYSLHLIGFLLVGIILWFIYRLHQAYYKQEDLTTQLKKQRNLYHTLSNLNQTIAQEQDPNALLQKTTEIIHQYTQIPVCWIGEIQSDTLKVLPIAASGIDFDTLNRFPIHLTGDPRHSQIIADQVYTEKQRILVQNYVTEKKQSPFYATLVQYGVKSMATYPICQNQQIQYLLFLYSFEPHFFDPETDTLLQELIEDLELALHKIHLEIQHQQAEQNLKIAAIAFESQEAIIITDAHENIIRVNQAFEQIYGYSQEDVLGKTPALLRSNHHPESFFKALWQALREQGRWQGEIWNRTKQGRIIPIYETITAVKDEHNQITHYIGHSVDLSHQKEAQRKIEQLQHYDPLTNLPNRLFLRSQLEHFAQQKHLQGILIILNISDFKRINDALGTQEGDNLLIETAQRLNKLFKETKVHQHCDMELIARIGADEFVIFAGISPNITAQENVARMLLNHLQKLLSPSFMLGKETHRIHFYYGITLIPAETTDTPSDWLRQADIALHHAKKHAHQPIAFYQSQMQKEIEHRHHMENALRHALKNNEFVMYYQPQICLKTGKVIGVETLIRWQKPNGELIPPFQFIPILEESNLMTRVGYWIIDNILQTIKKSPLIIDNHIQVSINLSAQQFNDKHLIRNILACIQKHQYPAHLIEFEVTESLLMDNLNIVKNKLQALQKHQIKIAIDDFGTGYSSFTYLKEFEVNKIKIDKSFIDNINQPKDRAIAQAIIDMCQALGAHSIAEGVETERQIQILKTLQCDEIQGYYYSKPLPFDEFIDFIKRNSDNT